MATRFAPYSATKAQTHQSVPSDRFAQVEERSQRTQPLTRTYEIASLLPCGSVRSSHHIAPSTDLFEATSSAFARGTVISTPNGPVAIEDLVPGDLVLTQDGTPQPVIWISATTYLPSHIAPASSIGQLTRLTQDDCSAAAVSSDLLLGPMARMLCKNASLAMKTGVPAVLIPARDMVDGFSAISISPPSSMKLYHLRLPRHAIILANGRPFETYHPGRGFEATLGPNMASLFLSMFPDISSIEEFGPLCYPRMSRETLDSLTFQ